MVTSALLISQDALRKTNVMGRLCTLDCNMAHDGCTTEGRRSWVPQNKKNPALHPVNLPISDAEY